MKTEYLAKAVKGDTIKVKEIGVFKIKTIDEFDELKSGLKLKLR